jgi:ribokinase
LSEVPVKNEKSLTVFGLGQCSLDHIAFIRAFPERDTKCPVTGLTVQGGGPVATALVALSRWGVRSTLAGVVGDDEAGGKILASLEEEGVDTSGLVIRQRSSSQFAFITAERRDGARTVFWQPPTGAPLAPSEIDLAPLKGADAFLTDGLFAEASLHAAREARRRNVPVIVDAGSPRNGMKALAGLSDHFIASETFGTALAGSNDPEAACRLIADLGAAVAAVTLGARGYVAIEDDRCIRGKAYPVKACDTTGCGDVFHAGYTFGLLRGWPLEERLDFAAWAAGCVAGSLGGRAGIPPADSYRTRPGAQA